MKLARYAPAEIIKGLTEAVNVWKDKSQLRDDMTLVVMKIK